MYLMQANYISLKNALIVLFGIINRFLTYFPYKQHFADIVGMILRKFISPLQYSAIILQNKCVFCVLLKYAQLYFFTSISMKLRLVCKFKQDKNKKYCKKTGVVCPCISEIILKEKQHKTARQNLRESLNHF